MATIKEAVSKIREVGVSNARIVPSGPKVKLEVKTTSGWVTLLTCERNIAEDLINQATRTDGNRVILG